MSFGELIRNKRKEMKISQKDLASRIEREDGVAITPQYLNDIEHDRRNPPSEIMLKQLAKELELEWDYLIYLSGKLPEDIQNLSLPQDDVLSAMKAFRRGQQEK